MNRSYQALAAILLGIICLAGTHCRPADQEPPAEVGSEFPPGKASDLTALVIDEQGRVGIGLAHPSVMLDVNGDVNVQNSVRAHEGFTVSTIGKLRSMRASIAKVHEAGKLLLFGKNGKLNVVLDFPNESFPNEGRVQVFDRNGKARAGMYVDGGRGVVYADSKRTVQNHPERPELAIVYTTLEGPEAAAYLHGTARLENGEARVVFPDHFRHVIVAEGISVQLTPRSADTYGLAAVDVDDSGVTVRELKGGKSDIEFYYTIIGVREGYENYQPVLSPSQLPIAHPPLIEATQ